MEEDVSEAKPSERGHLKCNVQQGTSPLARRRLSARETVRSGVNVKGRITFKNYVAKITQNPFFDGFIIVSNILDTVFMALETDYNLKYKNFNFFMIAEDFFMAVYIMQFLMKVYVEPRTYWKNGYNMLDAAILVASVIMLTTNGGGFGSHRYAGTIRAFRSLRLLKAVSIIPEIQAICTGIFRTMKGAVHVLGLMLLLLFNFGVIGCFYFGNPDPEHWGDLPSSMFTLFMLFTLDGWTHLQKAFDDLGLNGSLGFTIVFIVIACFIIFNVFIGVTITEVEYSVKTFEAEVQSEKETRVSLKKKAIIQQCENNTRKLIQNQMGNEQHFTRLAEHLKNSVLHTDSMVVNDGCTGLSFIDTYLSILEHQKITMNKLQQLCNEATCIFSEVLEEDLLQQALKERNSRSKKKMSKSIKK